MTADRLLGVALALACAACGSADDAAARDGDGLTGEVTVFAAASLTDTFTALAERFEQQHPGTEVTTSFGPSSGLARQVTEGAPADVFASASAQDMDAVVRAGLADDPRAFARNSPQVVVPADNPAGVTQLADLGRPGVDVALCQPEVPCGRVAARVLDQAGVEVRPVTLEADVRAALTKVRLGEVDAAIVYVTDVRAAGDDVRGVDLPPQVDTATTCPIATVGEGRRDAVARAFVDLVLSPAGRAVLADAGFAAP